MRLEKNGALINSLTDWERLAPPKHKSQWVEGRSAYELARAWCGTRGPAVPDGIRKILDSLELTRGLIIEQAYPEHRITFDSHGGEPRNADLAFVGHVGDSTIAVTIEAKADEAFGKTVAETVATALERAIQNPLSQGVRRVEHLVRALFTSRGDGRPKVSDLRYQMLTATAGTIAFALAEEAATAVLLVHEFVTNKTDDHLHARNLEDFRAFLCRLGTLGPVPSDAATLAGPFVVPGEPLFHHVPPLYVGKVVTNTRGVCA
jgi:hypothetical protein